MSPTPSARKTQTWIVLTIMFESLHHTISRHRGMNAFLLRVKGKLPPRSVWVTISAAALIAHALDKHSSESRWRSTSPGPSLNVERPPGAPPHTRKGAVAKLVSVAHTVSVATCRIQYAVNEGPQTCLGCMTSTIVLSHREFPPGICRGVRHDIEALSQDVFNYDALFNCGDPIMPPFR